MTREQNFDSINLIEVIKVSFECSDLENLRENLVKIGAKVVKHSGYVFFQMEEVMVLRLSFYDILERILILKLIPITPGSG